MRRFIVIIILIALSIQAQAQSVPFVTIQAASDNLALGGAHVAGPYSMPLDKNNLEAGFGKTLWQTKAINYNLSNIMIRLRVIQGLTLGFEYTANSMDKYVIYDVNGNPKGNYQPNEMYAGLNIWFSPIEKLALRVSGRYIRSSLAADTDAQTFAADVCGVYKIGKMLNIGLEARNIGNKLNYGYGEYALPATFLAGAYGTFPLAEKHKLEAALDGGAMPAYSTFLASAGAGYIFNDMIAVRAGAHISTNVSVLPTYFSVGLFFTSRFFDIGGAFLTAANTFSLTARIRL